MLIPTREHASPVWPEDIRSEGAEESGGGHGQREDESRGALSTLRGPSTTSVENRLMSEEFR